MLQNQGFWALKMELWHGSCYWKEATNDRTKSWIFYIYTQEIRKVKLFTRKLCQMYPVKATWCTIQCTQWLHQVSRASVYKTKFSCKQFADFPYVVCLEKSSFVHSLVAFPYNNICYCKIYDINSLIKSKKKAAHNSFWG